MSLVKKQAVKGETTTLSVQVEKQVMELLKLYRVFINAPGLAFTVNECLKVVFDKDKEFQEYLMANRELDTPEVMPLARVASR